MAFAIMSAAAFIALTARFLHGFGMSVFDVVLFTAPWSAASLSAIALARKQKKSSIAYGGVGGICGTFATYAFDMVVSGNLFPWPANQCLFLFAGFACCGMITAGIVSAFADGLSIQRRGLQGLAESGSRAGFPAQPHTTVHAAPHTAIRRRT